MAWSTGAPVRLFRFVLGGENFPLHDQTGRSKLVKYRRSGAFRRALEKRLIDQSAKTGISLTQLRKMVVFNRFLARLVQAQPDDWVFIGGLALQLRLGGKGAHHQTSF